MNFLKNHHRLHQKMISSLLIVFFIFSVNIQFANASDYQGPYAKRVDGANVAQQIVHLLDNATVGSVQTVVGASHIVLYFIFNSLLGDPGVDMRAYSHPTSEVNQIKIDEPVLNACAYSLGVFQIGQCAEDHEGGHSIASASLGPLYLPSVALSYMIEGHHDSLFEKWADLDAAPKGFSWTNQVQVGTGHIDINGESVSVMAIKFSLDQTQDQSTNELAEKKFYRWLNSEILIPLSGADSNPSSEGTCESSQHPFLFDISLLSRDMELVVNNLDLDLPPGQDMFFFIRSRHEYLNVENPDRRLIFINPLRWENQVGLEYKISEDVTARVAVGGVVGTSLYSPERYSLTEGLRFDLSGGISTQADIELYDFVRISGGTEHTWGTSGLSRTEYRGEITNEFRNPLEDFGFIHYFEFGAKASHESISIGNEPSLDITRVDATAGFRF